MIEAPSTPTAHLPRPASRSPAADIDLVLGNARALVWAQQRVTEQHYLHKPVDSRCRPVAFIVTLRGAWVGCFIVGRPEATACYDGDLTYGPLHQVADGKAQYSYWEVLNVARIWLHPDLQPGGAFYGPYDLPGFVDRRGVFRSTLLTGLLSMLSLQVCQSYLLVEPPCFLDEPYLLKALMSYCDSRVHRGTLYRAAEWQQARVNSDGIETWWRPLPHTPDAWDAAIRATAERSQRSRRKRAERAAEAVQGVLV